MRYNGKFRCRLRGGGDQRSADGCSDVLHLVDDDRDPDVMLGGGLGQVGGEFGEIGVGMSGVGPPPLKWMRSALNVTDSSGSTFRLNDRTVKSAAVNLPHQFFLCSCRSDVCNPPGQRQRQRLTGPSARASTLQTIQSARCARAASSLRKAVLPTPRSSLRINP